MAVAAQPARPFAVLLGHRVCRRMGRDRSPDPIGTADHFLVLMPKPFYLTVTNSATQNRANKTKILFYITIFK